MKLPNFRRLFKTDFSKEFQDLVDQLSVSINIGIETLYEALNKRLTFRDNFSCTVKDLTVTVDAAGKPKNSLVFQMDVSGKVDGVVVLYAVNNTNATKYVETGVHVSWTQTQNGVSINNIKGLYPNDEYTLRVVVFTQ